MQDMQEALETLVGTVASMLLLALCDTNKNHAWHLSPETTDVTETPDESLQGWFSHSGPEGLKAGL